MTPAAAAATTNTGNAVVFDNVYLGFDEGDILRGVSFSVPARETMVLLGETGTGKTLTLKLAAGLLKPTRGSVHVLGQEVSTMSENELLRLRERIGFVFQEGALFDSMTCGENVAFPLHQRTKLKGTEIAELVQTKLDAVGLKDVMERMPSEISGGMRKRVGLARALALDPKIVLYDEPTTGLDPITTLSVDEMVVNAAQQFKVTSLVISHDVGSALRMADHLAVIYEGKIVADGDPQEVRASQHPFVREFFSVWFGTS